MNVHAKAYLFSEIIDELKTTIWYNKIESIVFLIEFNELGAVYTDSINFLYKHKCNIFWEVIYNNYHIDADFLINVDE